jgi:hypothetical protein
MELMADRLNTDVACAEGETRFAFQRAAGGFGDAWVGSRGSNPSVTFR